MPEPENEHEGGERSADFQLPAPAPAKGAIYLSWGGKVYGPSTREEVVAGLRTAWFEDDTLYWHEGLDQWKHVREFPFSEDGRRKEGADPAPRMVMPAAPSLPAAAKEGGRRHGHSRRHRTSKPSSHRLGGKGRALVFGFVLLAVLLTVGILLLLAFV